MKKRLAVIIVMILSVLILTEFTARAEYPDKRIKFIVPFSAGGGADLSARTLVQYANPYLGNKLYVTNVEGGGGAIGFHEGASAPADGYTVMMLVTSIVIGPHITKGYPTYDLFDPICLAVLDPLHMYVRTDSPFKTFKDLITYAKANPGKVSVTYAGVGAVDHLVLEALMEATGTKFNLIPFKGVNPALMATVGGHVDVGVGGVSDSMTLVQGGKLRPLVVFDKKRSSIYPQVATVKEEGFDVTGFTFRAVAVPKGTPPAVKKVISDAFGKAATSAEFKQSVIKLGMEPAYLGPQEFGPWLKEQNEFFKGVAKKIGLTPQ